MRRRSKAIDSEAGADAGVQQPPAPALAEEAGEVLVEIRPEFVQRAAVPVDPARPATAG